MYACTVHTYTVSLMKTGMLGSTMEPTGPALCETEAKHVARPTCTQRRHICAT